MARAHSRRTLTLDDYFDVELRSEAPVAIGSPSAAVVPIAISTGEVPPALARGGAATRNPKPTPGK